MLRLRPTAHVLLGIILSAAMLNAPARAAELNQYLPDSTFLIVTLNFQQLQDAPLIKGEEKAFKEALGEVGKLLEGFGVDPAKDVNRLAFALGEQLLPKDFLLLLEGRFDPAKVQGRLEELAKDPKNNVQVTKQDTATLFQITVPQENLPNPTLPNQFWLTVLDANFIAVAIDRDALTEALARRVGTRKAEVKKEVLELAGKINPKETVSLVFVPPGDLLAGSPAAGLTNVTGGVTVSDSVRTDLLLATRDAESAQAIATLVEDVLNQIKQLLPLVAGQLPGFEVKEQEIVKEIMDTFKIAATETGVTIKSNISKEFIEKHFKSNR